MADVLDAARARLARLRAGEAVPLGTRERHGVLVALQYDLRPDDHVRELVAALVDDLERDGEGLDEIDVLGTYLLAPLIVSPRSRSACRTRPSRLCP